MIKKKKRKKKPTYNSLYNGVVRNLKKLEDNYDQDPERVAISAAQAAKHKE